MKPEEAWSRLIAGLAEPAPLSSLDYVDHAQVTRSVLIDGERWVVLIRRSEP